LVEKSVRLCSITMELGLNLAMTHWDTGAEPNVGLAQEAERLGFSSV